MARILHPNSVRTLLLIRRFIHHTQKTSIVGVSNLQERRIPKKSKSSGAFPLLSRESRLKEAIDALNVMDKQGITTDSQTYASLLKLCTDMKALKEGKQVHAHMKNSKIKLHFSLGTKLVSMYVKCASLDDARQVFDKMPKRTIFLWSSIIGGYVRQGNFEEALNLYKKIPAKGMEPDRLLFVLVLKACSQQLGGLELGKKVHDDIVKSGFESDVLVGNAVIEMYGKCGDLENARQVFDKMSHRNVISWTSIIAAYVQKSRAAESFDLLRRMQAEGLKVDSVTVTTILPMCANLGALDQGKEIHGYIVRGEFEVNVFGGSALVDMYAKCGNTRNARRLFDKLPKRDVVLWNAMVATYTKKGQHKEAQELFHQMQSDGIEQNVISWNAIIGGCAQNGHGVDALKLFQQMQKVCVRPNFITIASVLPSCAHLMALQKGKEIHGYILRSGVKVDAIVASALASMYAKSGSLEAACRVFEKASQRDLIAWNTMIGAYAMHGHGDKALELFYEMQLAGMKPNSVTFGGVLSACSHAGMDDEGWYLFNSMVQEYQLIPDADHYASMVDLLSRGGRLNQAHAFIKKMPIEPNASAWGALLAACRVHGNIELGKLASEHVFALEPDNSANYVQLSHIYAAAGRWDEVSNVRKMMEKKGLSKTLGCSWVEAKNGVHTFQAEDRSQPQSERIHALLNDLTGQMKEARYTPNTNFELLDLEGQENEYLLCGHSEKLAVGFGLLNTCPRKPIRIMKNLRVCGDCHNAIKFISKIVGREIIVRDSNCFHNFKHGLCSCGDYW